MKLDPSKHYRMPLLMGPLFDRDTIHAYRHVEVLAFQYLTAADAVAALLPECYRTGPAAARCADGPLCGQAGSGTPFPRLVDAEIRPLAPAPVRDWRTVAR
jgi:hypothetical protein